MVPHVYLTSTPEKGPFCWLKGMHHVLSFSQLLILQCVQYVTAIWSVTTLGSSAQHKLCGRQLVSPSGQLNRKVPSVALEPVAGGDAALRA